MQLMLFVSHLHFCSVNLPFVLYYCDWEAFNLVTTNLPFVLEKPTLCNLLNLLHKLLLRVDLKNEITECCQVCTKTFILLENCDDLQLGNIYFNAKRSDKETKRCI